MRLVVSFVRLVCLSSSFVSYGAPFRPAARSFSFRPSWRSCIAFSCRPVFALAFRLVVLFPRLVSPSRCGVSSVRPARRLVCLVSWGGSFLFSCLFLCLRRFILLVARSCPLSVHVPTIAVVSDAAVRHGVAGLLFASHPSHHLLLVRSSGGGAVPCCSSLVHRFIHALSSSPISSVLFALIACPHIINEGGDRQISRGAVKENGRAIMASNKTTRRIQRDARRDDGNETKDETRGIGNNGTRTRKQRDAGGMTGTEHEEQTKERDARRDDGTRDGETRRPLTKKRKDNDDNGDDTVPLLASTQHAQDDKSGYLFSSFARPPLPGSPYFVGLI